MEVSASDKHTCLLAYFTVVPAVEFLTELAPIIQTIALPYKPQQKTSVLDIGKY